MTGALHQGCIGIKDGIKQSANGGGDARYLLFGGMTQKPHQPGQDRGQIMSAYHQGTTGIQQPFRHLAPHTGHTHWQNGTGREGTGIAERATLACIQRVNKSNAMPVTLRPGSSGSADYSRSTKLQKRQVSPSPHSK